MEVHSMKKIRDINILMSLSVYVCAIGLVVITQTEGISYGYEIKGFEKTLESIINFSAIIIGFYTAMYGVLLTLKNSDIFQNFKFHNAEKIVKFQLYESLISSFLILILSIALQILINYINPFTNFICAIWLGTLFIFVVSTFRAISLLLKIMFNHSGKEQEASVLGESKQARYDSFKKKQEDK